MKFKSAYRLVRAGSRNLAIALVSLLAVNAAQSASLYWDGIATDWATNTNWWTTVSGTTNPATAPLATDSVVFNGTGVNGPMNVQLGAAAIITGMTFNNTGTTLIDSSSTTARTLTLGTGGITINSGAGAVTLGDATNTMNIVLNGMQTWTVASGATLNVKNLVNNNSGNLIITNSGTVNFSGGYVSNNQGFELRGGTFNWTAGNGLINTFNSGGNAQTTCRIGWGATFNLSGGSFTVACDDAYTGGNSEGFTIGGGTAGMSGTLNVSGGTFTSMRQLNLGGNSQYLTNGSGTLTVSGTGVVDVSLQGQIDDAYFGGLQFGTRSGGGVANLDGGTVKVGGGIGLYAEGASTLNLNSGTIKAMSNGTLIDAGGTYLTTNVLAGGAVFDTNGFTTTIGSNVKLVHLSGDSGTDGGLTKNGTGTLTLSSANTFNGPTAVNAGTLIINGVQAPANSVVPTVTVSSGAALGGSGNVGGNVVVSAGGALNLTPSAVVGTLTVPGTLTLSGTSVSKNSLYFDTNTTSTDSIAVTGAVISPDAAVVSINGLSAATLTAGNYNLITGAAGIDSTKFTLATTTAFGNTLSLVNSTSTALKLTATAAAASPATAFWSGTSNASWGTLANWKTTVSNNTTVTTTPGPLTDVSFYTTTPAGTNLTITLGADFEIKSLTYLASATSATTIDGSNMLSLKSGGITVNTPSSGTPTHTISAKVGLEASQTWTVNTNAALTVSGVISDFGGAYGLTKSGVGTLTLSGANTYLGTTTVSAGTLAISSPGTLGGTLGNVAALTTNGGVLDLGTTTQKVGALSLGGAATIQNGSLTGTSYAASNTSGNATVSANLLANGVAGFTMSGSGGTVTLSGANTYIGWTTVTNGTLAISGSGTLGNAAPLSTQGGVLDLGNTTQTVGFVEFRGGTVQNGSLNASAYNCLKNTTITANLTGSANFVMEANNYASALFTAILSGNNHYTGATLLSQGTLQANHATALGDGGDITFASKISDRLSILQYTSASASQDWSTRFKNSNRAIRLDTNGQNVVLAGVIDNSNTGGLTMLGVGTLTLSGSASNMYTGLTTVSAGTLGLAKTGSAQAVTGGGLTIGVTTANTAATVQYTAASSDMMGTGAVTLNGRGILDFNGKTDTIGNVAIVSTGATTTNPTPIINTAGGGNLTIGALAITPVAGFVSQINTNGGTLTLGGDVTFTAATTGQAQISGNLSMGSAGRTITVGAGSGANQDLLIDAAISGSGLTLTKAGTGRLVLSGTNSYGSTTITGVLQFNQRAAIPSAGGRNITVNASSVVALGYVASGSIQSNLLSRLVASSAGAVALTANTNENFDFSSAGNNFIALYLGAIGNATYSGSLTPNATAGYKLGGGGGALTLSNALGGSNALTINGNVTLQSGISDYTGITAINAGVLSVGTLANGGTESSIGKSSNAASNLVFGTATLQYAGTTVPSDRNFTITPNTTGTFDITQAGTTLTLPGATGSATTGALTKTGAGTLTLTGTNTYTGTTTVSGGTLALSGTGSINTSSSITLNNAGLTLVNTNSTEGVIDRIKDAGTITVTGGSITYTNTSGDSLVYAETIGTVALQSSGQLNTVLTNNQTGTGNTQTLTLANLTRSAGASVVAFSAPATGPNATTNKITNSGATASSWVGPWAAIGSAANAQTDYAYYDASKNIVGANITASEETTWGTSGNFTLSSGTTLTATRTITSLRYTGGANTLALGANNLETFGILNGGSGKLTISGAGGVRQNGTAATNVYVTTGNNDIDISAAIANNTGALGLVKSGVGGILTLSGSTANTYTGLTTVNSGTLLLSKLSGSTATKAIAGALTINAGAAVQYAANTTNPDMIGANAVTINGTGQLDFNGATDTIGAVTIVTSGAVANTTPITNTAGGGNLTISALGITPVAGFKSVINSGSGTLTLGGDVTFTAATTGQAQISGNLALGGATRTLSVGLGMGTVPGYDLDIEAVISGGGGFGITKTGTGTLALTGTNLYTGATSVNAGTLKLGQGGSLAATAVSVASGATFGVNQTTGSALINGGASLSLANGSFLDLQDTKYNTLAISGTVTLSGATLKFDISTDVNDQLTFGGAATVSGTNLLSFNTPNGSAATGQYTLISATAGGLDYHNFGLSSSNIGSYSLSGDTNHIYLNVLDLNNSSLWVGATQPTTSGQTTSDSKDFGRVLRGSNPSANITLHSTGTHASATNANVVSTLDATSTSASASTLISTLTASGINVGLNTTTTGAKSGAVTLANLATTTSGASLGSDNGNAIITVSGTVVADRSSNISVALGNIGRQLTGATASLTGQTLNFTSAGANNLFTSVTIGSTTYNGTNTSGTLGGQVANITSVASNGTATIAVTPSNAETNFSYTPATLTNASYTATAVASRTVNAPATTALGTYHAGAAVNITSNAFGYSYGSGGSGAQANTEDTTVQAASGTPDANGIVLSGGPNNVNSSATFTCSFTGTAMVSSSGGSISSLVNPEFSPATSVSAPYSIGVYSGDMVWGGSTSGTWDTNAKWSDNMIAGVPFAPGMNGSYAGVDTARFNGTGAGTAISLTSGSSPSVKNVMFSGATGYTLNGSGAANLTLMADSGNAAISSSSSVTQTIIAPVALASDVAVGVTGSGQLTLSGNITGTSRTLTKSGGGILELAGTNNYGDTSVTAGTLLVNGGTTGNVTVTGGTSTLGGTGSIT
ncbi:MAG: autotransporter-associated beta strand repeat-containing protein, partial [Verrucomicrobiota bacterium]